MKIGVMNILGEFVFDGDKLLEERLLKTPEQVIEYILGNTKSELCKKHNIEPISYHISPLFEETKYVELMRKNNIIATRNQVANSVQEETLLIQAMSTLNELDPVLNRLTKKMREWYALYNPEFEKSITNNDAFIRLIIEKDREDLLKELGVEQTMGGNIPKRDKEFLQATAKDISVMFERREKIIDYVKEVSQKIMPNVIAITGPVMGTRMLAIAGSLEKFSKYPSSTVQLLGAENALFKHIRTGSRCPKYGFLINHPLVTKTAKKLKGKTARAIADKVAIAAKVDYFKGAPIGEKLREQLEKRFG